MSQPIHTDYIQGIIAPQDHQVIKPTTFKPVNTFDRVVSVLFGIAPGSHVGPRKLSAKQQADRERELDDIIHRFRTEK